MDPVKKILNPKRARPFRIMVNGANEGSFYGSLVQAKELAKNILIQKIMFLFKMKIH